MALSEPAIEALNRTYHDACFQCRSCHLPLAGKQYYNKAGIPLCEDCYQVGPSPFTFYQMINGLYSYCAFSLDDGSKHFIVEFYHSPIHTHIHTVHLQYVGPVSITHHLYAAGSHHRKEFLAQGHFDMQNGGDWDQTTDPLFSGQLALSAKPQPPL